MLAAVHCWRPLLCSGLSFTSDPSASQINSPSRPRADTNMHHNTARTSCGDSAAARPPFSGRAWRRRSVLPHNAIGSSAAKPAKCSCYNADCILHRLPGRRVGARARGGWLMLCSLLRARARHTRPSAARPRCRMPRHARGSSTRTWADATRLKGASGTCGATNLAKCVVANRERERRARCVSCNVRHAANTHSAAQRARRCRPCLTTAHKRRAALRGGRTAPAGRGATNQHSRHGNAGEGAA